jgi:hypothetical protein
VWTKRRDAWRRRHLLLGCTPANYPPQTTTLVINAKTHNSASINGITGSDEVFFNAWQRRGARRGVARPERFDVSTALCSLGVCHFFSPAWGRLPDGRPVALDYSADVSTVGTGDKLPAATCCGRQ